MKPEKIDKIAAGMAYVVVIGVLLLMLHNSYFNKDLNVTTACEQEDQEPIDTRPVWEIYGSNVLLNESASFRVDERERLMQSCKAWQHNYNFLNNIILPGIGLMFLSMLIRQYAKQISEGINRAKKHRKEDYGFSNEDP